MMRIYDVPADVSFMLDDVAYVSCVPSDGDIAEEMSLDADQLDYYRVVGGRMSALYSMGLSIGDVIVIGYYHLVTPLS